MNSISNSKQANRDQGFMRRRREGENIEPQIGKEYQVNHSRKGKFCALVKTVSGEWATLELTAGRAKAMCSYNEVEAGEEVTVRLSHCKFTEQPTAV